MSILPAEGRLDGKILPIPGTNQIAGINFVEFRPLTHWEKNKW